MLIIIWPAWPIIWQYRFWFWCFLLNAFFFKIKIQNLVIGILQIKSFLKMVTKCKQIIWARSMLGPISNRTWAQPDCFSCTSSVPFRFIFPLVFNLSEFAAVVSLEKLPSSLTIVRNHLPPFLSPIWCARVYVKTGNLSWVSDFMIWALVIFLIFFLSNLKDWTFCF